MRILYFTRDYTPHDFRFLTVLAKSEHDVYSLRLENRGNKLENRLLPSGVHPLEWKGGKGKIPFWRYPQIASALKQVINTVKPDILHAGPIHSAAFIAALSGFSPLVSMSWGSDILIDADKNPIMRDITSYVLKRSSVLLGDCQAVKQKAQTFGMNAERTVLFPWGVDLNHFSPGGESNIRHRLGWEDDFVLLSLRTWEPVYGVDIIIKAFIQAAPHIPDMKLLLLGSGSQEKTIRKILDKSNLNHRVHFGGRVSNPQLPEYYRAADLYLSASHSDGSSVSLMEALACACPVLVSDIPGNLEWITPGKEGWLFSDGNVDQLSKALLKISACRMELPNTGSNARKLAEQRADWSVNSQKLFEAYYLAISNPI